jgi:hypothetical protein
MIGIAVLQDSRTVALSFASSNSQIFDNLLTLFIHTLRQMRRERTLTATEETVM